jgi:hypothetical protein
MSTILGLLARHFLTGMGAALISRGLDPTSAETLVGGASILGGLIWSWWQKRQAAK